MAPKIKPVAPTQNWTRRSVVEWLGKATVFALGAEVLAACGADSDLVLGGEGGGSPAGECGPDAQLPFEPGEENLALYADWKERTVDRPDLERLLASWQLTVDGLVDSALTLSFAELLALPRQDQVTDFHCVEGWSVHDVPWNGVHLSELLALVGPLSTATHVTFHCSGGVYSESLPLEVALEPRTMLGYGVGCETLPLRHGFPLRVVVPRKFGYKNAKYIERIELTDEPVDGFWVAYGYTYEADVEPSRLRPGKY